MSVSNDGYERFERMTMNAGNTCEISAASQNAAGTIAVVDGSVCLGKPRTGAVVGGVYTDQFAELNGIKIDFHNGEATTNNDYDARIEVSGVSAGNGGATLSIDCGELALNCSAGGLLFDGTPGDAGDFLVSQGAGATPEWVYPFTGLVGSILYMGADGKLAFLVTPATNGCTLQNVDGLPAWTFP